MTRKIIGWSLLGLFIVAALWWWLGGMKDPFRYYSESYGEVAVADPQQWVNVIAIDMDATGLLDRESVLNGTDSILAVEPERVPGEVTIEEKPSAILDGILVLHEFDQNKDSWIDAGEPAYNRLVVLTFVRRGTRLRELPLHFTGIRVIYLSPTFVESSRQLDDRRFRAFAGHVVMADGSKRPIKIVRILRREIPGG